MQADLTKPFVTLDDCLVGELTTEVCHEYLGGMVFPRADSSMAHNIVIGNLIVALRPALRGSRSRVYAINLKLRLQLGGVDFFYYPDVMVACDPRDKDPYFKRFPQSVD